jgi:hypothetical protein
LLVAGALHFVVFLDVGDPSTKGLADAWGSDNGTPRSEGSRQAFRPMKRRRFVSSIREVVDADGMQVVSNEVFRPGGDLYAVPGAPLRSRTLDELFVHGYRPRFAREDPSW